MGIAFGDKEGYETCDYVIDTEHRRTIEEANEIKERWEKSGRYFDVSVIKTLSGYAIEGYKRVRPYII